MVCTVLQYTRLPISDCLRKWCWCEIPGLLDLTAEYITVSVTVLSAPALTFDGIGTSPVVLTRDGSSMTASPEINSTS